MVNQAIIHVANADIYQRENIVLQGVNLDVNEGEFVYIIGKVGSGKSSLIKTMNAEIPLIAGEMEVAGHKLHTLKNREIPMLRRKLGVVFQDFRLLTDRSIRENLEFTLRAVGWKKNKLITERVIEALHQTDMEKYIDKMPHQLSGGEQQRVVIARALLNEPQLILADEPTGNLDPDTSEQILCLLKELNAKGKTIVMASHDYALIGRHRARTLVCENFQLRDTSHSGGQLDFDEMLANNRI
ncbi:MAG: ATP-binding cassette domain-containing protein [Prolixibacteraceae bacterium]|nr:ATP-binding cassette domain-containing protein [Prolixibacteraceae bacterium]